MRNIFFIFFLFLHSQTSFAKDPFYLPLTNFKSFEEKFNVTFVDVREEFEFKKKSIHGVKVVNIPLTKLQHQHRRYFIQFLEGLDKKSKIVFICPTGSRAQIAMNFALANHFDARYSRYVSFAGTKK